MNCRKITRLWPNNFIIRSPVKDDYFKLTDVLLDNYNESHKTLWQLFQLVNDSYWSLPAVIRDIGHFAQSYATSLYIINIFILLDLKNVNFDVAFIEENNNGPQKIVIKCIFNHNIIVQLMCSKETYNYNSGFHSILYLQLLSPIPH